MNPTPTTPERLYAPRRSNPHINARIESYVTVCLAVARDLKLKENGVYRLRVLGTSGRTYAVQARFEGYSSPFCGSAIFAHPLPFDRLIPTGWNKGWEERTCETLAVPTSLIVEATPI